MRYEGLETLRRVALYLFAGLLAAFFTAVYFVDRERYGAASDDPLIARGIHARIRETGTLKWEFWARTAEFDSSAVRQTVNAIYKGKYYRRDGPPFSFTAQRGWYDRDAKVVRLEGAVRLRSPNGDYISSPLLVWNATGGHLAFPQGAALYIDGNYYRAGSIESNGDSLSFFTATKKVRIYIPDMYSRESPDIRRQIRDSGVKPSYFKRITLTAERIQYDSVAKILYCFPTLDQLPVITPPGRKKPPAAPGTVRLHGRGFDMSATEMQVDFQRKNIRSTGTVKILNKGRPDLGEKGSPARAAGKKDTTILTSEALYYWKDSTMELSTGMEMIQKTMHVTAGRAFINLKDHTAVLAIGVLAKQFSGDWLLKEKIIGPGASENVRKSAIEESTLSCDTLTADLRTEDLQAYGSVFLKQKKKSAKSDTAAYDRKNEKWTLTGNAYAASEKNEIAADTLIYEIKPGALAALGNVRAGMLPDPEHKQDIIDYYRDRDGAAPPRGFFEKDRATVTAPGLRYNEKKDVLTATGGARLVYRDITIEADTMQIDYARKTATGEGKVTATDPFTRTLGEKFSLDWSTRDITIIRDVRYTEKGREATATGDKRDPLQMTADRLDYNWKSRRGTATGHVQADSAGRTATAAKLSFDADREFYLFTGSVKLHQDNGEWLETRGVFDPGDEQSRKLARKPTDITCDTATLDDTANTALFEGDVTVTQSDRQLRTDTLAADSATRVIKASGSVSLRQTSGEWLFEDGFVDDDTDDDTREKLRGPITVKAGKLTSWYSKKNILLEDHVTIRQGKSSAAADSLDHNGEKKITTLDGNVTLIDEKGRSLRAGRVVYDRKSKTTEAFNSVRGQTDVKKE